MNLPLKMLSVVIMLLFAATASAGVRYLDSRYEKRIPVWFDVEGKGLTLKPLELEWNVSDYENLIVGDIKINASSVKILRGQPRAIFQNPSWMQKRIFNFWDEESLIFQWPLGLFAKGTVEAISRSGRTVWSWNFEPEDLKLFEEDVMTGGGLDTVAFPNPSIRAKSFMDFSEPFRICISNAGSESSSRLCTTYYEWVKKGVSFEVEKVDIESKKSRVIIDQKDVALMGRYRVPTKRIVSFFAQSPGGFTYEFFAKVRPFELVEAYEREDGTIGIVSTGLKPSLPTRPIRRFSENELAELFKWNSTIGDFREFWEVSVPKNNTVLYIPGEGAGVFRQEFVVTQLPKEKERAFLESGSPLGTYVDGTKLYGFKLRSFDASSTENSAESTSADQFRWKFRAKERGEFNESRIQFKSKDGNEFFGKYELFKGYPGEISARLGGQFGSNGDLIILGDTTATYWFENIAGWNNYWVSRLRWGISGRYFRSLNQFKIKEETDGVVSTRSGILQSTNIDLKYRLTPGIAGHDETWGLILGYDRLIYDVFSSNRLGAGVLWARSMPQVFDGIFNLIPIFRFPKYVDAEFVAYPVLISSPNMAIPQGAKLNFNLNFHGKVMWTKRFYGEGGFGLRSIFLERSFPDNATTKRKELGYVGLHGTVGVGLQF